MPSSGQAQLISGLVADELFGGEAAAPAPAEAPAAQAGASSRPEVFPTAAAASTDWPRIVPPLADALKYLQKQLPLPEAFTAATTQVLTTLSPETIAAIRSAGPSGNVLRVAVACRWRLTVALEARPLPGARTDKAGIEEMLAETDAALASLRPPEGSPPDVVAAFDATRGALAKCAVDFSELVQKVGAEQPQEGSRPSAKAAPRPAEKGATRMVVTETVSKTSAIRSARRSFALWIAFGVVVAAGAAFHLWRAMPNRQPSASSWAPQGTFGIGASGSGPRILLVPGGKALSPEALQKLQAEVGDHEIRQIGPGQYLIARPPGAGAPAQAPPPR